MNIFSNAHKKIFYFDVFIFLIFTAYLFVNFCFIKHILSEINALEEREERYTHENSFNLLRRLRL